MIRWSKQTLEKLDENSELLASLQRGEMKQTLANSSVWIGHCREPKQVHRDALGVIKNISGSEKKYRKVELRKEKAVTDVPFTQDTKILIVLSLDKDDVLRVSFGANGRIETTDVGFFDEIKVVIEEGEKVLRELTS